MRIEPPSPNYYSEGSAPAYEEFASKTSFNQHDEEILKQLNGCVEELNKGENMLAITYGLNVAGECLAGPNGKLSQSALTLISTLETLMQGGSKPEATYKALKDFYNSL